MNNRRHSQQRRSRGRTNGTAAVELAIVLPLLLLLVFGCIDFGRVAYYSTALDNSVGCGSQYAATHRFTDYTAETWEARVKEAVADDMQGVPEFDRTSLRITVSSNRNIITGAVLVTVTATYPFQTIVDWPGLPKDVLLKHSVTALQYQ